MKTSQKEINEVQYSARINIPTNNLENLFKKTSLYALLEWCTPEYISEYNHYYPISTYDGCGGSSDDRDSRYLVHEISIGRKSNPEWELRNVDRNYQPSATMKDFNPETKKAVKDRRLVLKHLFNKARTNQNLRQVVLSYEDKIKKFLRRYDILDTLSHEEMSKEFERRHERYLDNQRRR
ncbi:MAG: hypothetical protein WC781_04665 [Candidatus Pacearchaeota archaeon]|jgi:hypothetical protein